jgi:hypothetical protein
MAEILFHLLVIFFVYQVICVGYRICFHPLSHFPGPWCAAASTLYRAYFQIWRDGDYVAQVTHLHEIYGTAILQNVTC